jgi:hypothetical protein
MRPEYRHGLLMHLQTLKGPKPSIAGPAVHDVLEPWVANRAAAVRGLDQLGFGATPDPIGVRGTVAEDDVEHALRLKPSGPSATEWGGSACSSI